MGMNNFNKKQKFSIRKYHFGAVSVLLGVLLGGASAQASEPVTISNTSTPAEVKTNLANVSTQKVEENLNSVEDKQVNAENALDTANKSKITALNNQVETTNADVVIKQKDADALKPASENSFESDAKINLSDAYVTALKKREAVVGGNFRNLQEFRDVLAKDPQRKAELDKTNIDLKRFSRADNVANTYTNPDKTEVNLWELTEKQKKEINFFAIDLINQVRAEFGKPALVTTKGMYEFAQEIASRSKRIYSKDEKHVVGYEYDLINQVAKEKGLNPDVPGKQRQVDLAQVVEKQEKWLNPKWADVFAEPGSTEFAEQKPIMTMGALKEQVYGEIKKVLFTPEGGLLKDSERYWELAMNTAGLSGRANMKYGAATVTARIFTYPNDPVTNTRWPKNEIRKLRFYLQNSFVAEENAPDTLAGQELNKIIDPTKFNKTALVNAPAAGQKYDAAKKLLEDAIELRDEKENEVDALKAVPSEVIQLQPALPIANSEVVEKAEEVLEDAKNFATTEADEKNQDLLVEQNKQQGLVRQNVTLLKNPKKLEVNPILPGGKALATKAENPVQQVPTGDKEQVTPLAQGTNTLVSLNRTQSVTKQNTKAKSVAGVNVLPKTSATNSVTVPAGLVAIVAGLLAVKRRKEQ